MFFRFFRRFGLFPGVRLNVGKRGVSVSAGIRGANVTVGKRGARVTVGAPGTGASISHLMKWRRPQPNVSGELPDKHERVLIFSRQLRACLEDKGADYFAFSDALTLQEKLGLSDADLGPEIAAVAAEVRALLEEMDRERGDRPWTT